MPRFLSTSEWDASGTCSTSSSTRSGPSSAGATTSSRRSPATRAGSKLARTRTGLATRRALSATTISKALRTMESLVTARWLGSESRAAKLGTSPRCISSSSIRMATAQTRATGVRSTGPCLVCRAARTRRSMPRSPKRSSGLPWPRRSRSRPVAGTTGTHSGSDSYGSWTPRSSRSVRGRSTTSFTTDSFPAKTTQGSITRSSSGPSRAGVSRARAVLMWFKAARLRE
mmetsp:Transcript_898/g.1952  ORF Transcript_898/g.1952 Transcript_898/m.1952 type:complete len:229 (+) Transcript_898:217-903(+)